MVGVAEEELVKNKGAVVNVSSVAAIIPSGTWGIYGVVKAAQDKLTTNMAFVVRMSRPQPPSVCILCTAYDLELPGSHWAHALQSSRCQLLHACAHPQQSSVSQPRSDHPSIRAAVSKVCVCDAVRAKGRARELRAAGRDCDGGD